MVSRKPVSSSLEQIPCAYCRGTGKDRFGVMSPLSRCGVCSGKGMNAIAAPLVRCAYCQGQGTSPTGARSSCLACDGKGSHSVPEQTQTCSHCKGSGVHRPTGFYCYQCHGSGLMKLS